jgi:hypothetical protein
LALDDEDRRRGRAGSERERAEQAGQEKDTTHQFLDPIVKVEESRKESMNAARGGAVASCGARLDEPGVG